MHRTFNGKKSDYEIGRNFAVNAMPRQTFSVIHADHLGKMIAGKTVLHDISLNLGRGRCLGIMGPNGSGKTTLLNVLSGLWAASWGSMIRLGIEVGHEPQSDSRVGYLGHRQWLYPDLTAKENLQFYACLWRLTHSGTLVEKVLDQVGLKWFGDERVKSFSRGMRQRLAIARVILTAPELLLLDEPYTGLDLSAQALLDSLLQERKSQGVSIILVSHHLREISKVADAVAILADGTFVWWAPLDRAEPPDLSAIYEEWVKAP